MTLFDRDAHLTSCKIDRMAEDGRGVYLECTWSNNQRATFYADVTAIHDAALLSTLREIVGTPAPDSKPFRQE